MFYAFFFCRVHIARHNEYEPHELDEYMFHVDEYYKIKELGGRIDKRRIYLATDEPTLFEKIQLKYSIMLNVKNL